MVELRLGLSRQRIRALIPEASLGVRYGGGPALNISHDREGRDRSS